MNCKIAMCDSQVSRYPCHLTFDCPVCFENDQNLEDNCLVCEQCTSVFCWKCTMSLRFRSTNPENCPMCRHENTPVQTNPDFDLEDYYLEQDDEEEQEFEDLEDSEVILVTFNGQTSNFDEQGRFRIFITNPDQYDDDEQQ